MKILAIDTSTTSCSVAIADERNVLAEVIVERKETHSKHLMTLIDAVLGISKTKLSEIDGFAVVKGPGSFTGLRIGISTIKGLALPLQKPVCGISSLDVLALQFPPVIPSIHVMIDARKKEVYYCGYASIDGEIRKAGPESVGSPETAISNIQESVLFVGNGALLYKDIIQRKIGNLACFAPPIQNTIRAACAARIAFFRLKSGQTDSLSTLAPLYIRKPDAVIKNC